MRLNKLNAVLLATMALVSTLQLAAARQLLVAVKDEPYSYMGLSLDSALMAKNVENRAVGTFKITNPSKEPIKIGSITYDFGFDMTYPFPMAADGIANLNMNDLNQILKVQTCGSTKLPTTIAPGASITCPFSSRMNIYGGSMSVVAHAFDAAATPDDIAMLNKVLAYDVLNPSMAAYNSKIRGGPEGNPTVKKTYTAYKDKAIPVHDIECEVGQQFCKICGGKAAVEAKCNAIPICVAYDMEDDKCGYIKQAKGPMAAKAGFTSWVAA